MNSVTLFLVDDDEVDRELIQRALTKAKIANPLRTAYDGMNALEILRGEGDNEKIQAPFIILLDWNMPRMNGLEFLQELRADENLKASIVFVLTTSAAERDKLSAYQQNVAGYIVKDRAGKDFLNLLSLLDTYWRIVEFP